MREMIAVRAPALPGKFLDARLGRRGIIRSLASHAGGPAPGRAAARPAPATSCGSVLWMLASDGGAPAPRRPAAHTASLGGGFGKGGEAPSEFDGMAILVTGAFGCIGSWVVKRLLAAGERPVVYDLGDDPWRMRMIVGPERLNDVAMIRGDSADRDAVVRVVGEHDITRIIHLAAWQVPLCRQDPSRGALVNVVGTANVFEAAKAHRERVSRVVYFSSAAVFGPPHLYGPGPVTDDAPPRPATHYGVYKVANEETARIYWEEHRIPSMGFRPLSVYGPGRDFGLTADPTLAMKAAVLG